MQHVLHVLLWSVQGLLAILFLAVGAPKVIGRGMEQWAGFSDLPRSLVVVIGCAEVLGAAGLVVPMATGILPWLTPLAAVGLAIIVLMAAGFHIRADERLQALETALWTGVAALVAVGRWDLITAQADADPSAFIVVLSILTISAIINLVVLATRITA